jgi:putative heme-binding domain-containing protein
MCHTLFGSGGKIGPELPGAFEDVDYLLQNIVDPNAIIGKDYQQTVVQTKNGQTVLGIVAAEDAGSVTLKSLAGPVILQRADIAQLSVLDISLMPEGLLAAMKEDDVRDLFSYLRRHGPVPMLASPANVNDFFTGSDLTHWAVSSAERWEVKAGEIIGRGSADRAEFITSDLTAESFRLRVQIAISGTGALAEIVLRGSHAEGGFAGVALRLGAGAPALLRYRTPGVPPEIEQLPHAGVLGKSVAVEVLARGEKLRVLLDGQPLCELSEPALGTRTNFQFRVAGGDAELRIKDLALALEP